MEPGFSQSASSQEDFLIPYSIAMSFVSKSIGEMQKSGLRFSILKTELCMYFIFIEE